MARTFAHWRPRYIFSRARDLLYRWQNPDAPYLHPEITAFLDRYLTPAHVGFEWGSGASTSWFAARCGRLTSIEYQREWFDRVDGALRAKGLRERVDLRLYEYRPDTKMPPGYVDAIRDVPDASLDFVLVDGRKRDRCALLAIPKVKPGGWLIVDNIERHLPPASPRWEEFAERVSGWRCRRLGNGVTETALWTKPKS